jgi:hypothetical protein
MTSVGLAVVDDVLRLDVHVRVPSLLSNSVLPWLSVRHLVLRVDRSIWLNVRVYDVVVSDFRLWNLCMVNSPSRFYIHLIAILSWHQVLLATRKVGILATPSIRVAGYCTMVIVSVIMISTHNTMILDVLIRVGG